MTSEVRGFAPVSAIVSGAAKIHRVGSEEGGRSWSLEFDPQTGRPTEALWQHQTLRVCGQCRDCKHYDWSQGAGDWGRCGCSGNPIKGLLMPPDFGCVHWKAKE